MATNDDFDIAPEDHNLGEFPNPTPRSNDPITPFIDHFQDTKCTHIILVMPGVAEPQVFYGDSIVLIQGQTLQRQYEAKIKIGIKIDKAKTTYTSKNGVFEFQFFT
jgi:HSP20 family molecular chaperone IbpA